MKCEAGREKDLADLREAFLGHLLRLSDDGQVYAWGGNEYLQCAVQQGQRDITSPVPSVPYLRVSGCMRVRGAFPAAVPVHAPLCGC